MNERDEPSGYGFSVVHQAVHTTSRNLAGTAGNIRGAADAHAAGVVAGASAHPNLATSQAVGRVGAAWAVHLKGHADRIDGHSAHLTTVLAQYQTTDGAVNGGAATVGAELPQTGV